MEYTKKFDSYVSKNFDKFIRKPELIYGVIILILALYSAHIAPKLPASIVKIFDNSFFKLFMFILILWVAQISPSISILLAVVFLLLLNYITTQKFWESLDNITTTYPPITIEPTPINAVNATNALTIQGLSATAAPQEVITSAAKTITGAIPEPTPVVVKALDTLIKSAASSITANIAEGFARYHFKDKIKFYYNSRGSAAEVQNFLLLAKDIGYINIETCKRLEEKANEVGKLINGLIKSTENQIDNY